MRRISESSMLPFGIALLAVGLLAGSLAAQAATLRVTPGGVLMGATGVDVEGTLYDVTFQDGSCISVFSGCDDAADFAFQTFSAASAAASALLDQVLLDSPAGQFDTQPGRTLGCFFYGPTDPCYILTPTQPSELGGLGYAFYTLNDAGTGDTVYVQNYAPTSDLSLRQLATWAVWERSPTVPLPAAAWLLLSGLGGLGLLRRRKAN